MKQLEIENALREYLVEELNNNNFNYSIDNFLLDTDDSYRGAILDFVVEYERLGSQVGPAGFCVDVNYVVSLQVPLDAEAADEAREESLRVQRAISKAILRVERCQPVKRVKGFSFLKSVVQDQYRSLEKPGALMVEVVASISLEYLEDFYD